LAVDELGGYPEHPLHPHSQELAFPEQLMDPGDHDAQLRGDLGYRNERW
jgi:hypothetical protein